MLAEDPHRGRHGFPDAILGAVAVSVLFQTLKSPSHRPGDVAVNVGTKPSFVSWLLRLESEKPAAAVGAGRGKKAEEQC